MDRPASPPDPGKGLLSAALVNLLSPGLYLFWSAVAGPAFLSGWQVSPGWGLAFVIGFYTAMVVTLLGLIGLAAGAARLHPRLSLALNGLAVVMLFGFGVVQIMRGVLGT
jgi:threonine/homoserine/homoserine lactone efflux protein